MKTLPVIPVETLATARAGNGNPGIVPPWLRPDRNPGIVPPWLRDPIVRPTEPVADDVPRILAADQRTVFEPLPIDLEPETPRIWRG